MEIKTNPIIKINKSNNITRNNLIKLPDIPPDAVEINPWIPEMQIINRLIGPLSKEDYATVKKLAKKYKKLSTEELSKLQASCETQISLKLNTPNLDRKTENGIKYIKHCQPNKITIKAQRNIKDEILKLLAINQVQDKPTKFSNFEYVKKWIKPEYGIQNTNITQGIYKHPQDLAKQLCGEFIDKDLKSIKSKELKYSKISVDKIINKKLSILDEINKYTNSPKRDFVAGFTNRQLKKLKELAIEYEALNRIQKGYDINTKSLETVLYSQNIDFSKAKVGDYINGLGAITDKIFVNNKPCIIIITRQSQQIALKLYDCKILNNQQGFLNNIKNKTLDINSLKTLNQDAEAIINNNKKSLISEVRFFVLSKDYFLKMDKNKPYIEKIKSIVDTKENIYKVVHFVNYNTKDYDKAAKVIATKLISLLNKNEDYPIFIDALAFNNSKHSPFNFYYRYGFKPYTMTEEEIKETINNNGANIPFDKEISLYLKSTKEIEDRIEVFEKRYLTSKKVL